jgi:hypothetical protein
MVRPRAAEIALLVAGLALLASAVVQVHHAASTNFPADLVVDHRTARAFWEGYNPFSPEGARRAGLTELGPTGLGHPPTTSFWILPLAPLKVEPARQVLAWIAPEALALSALVSLALLALAAWRAREDGTTRRSGSGEVLTGNRQQATGNRQLPDPDPVPAPPPTRPRGGGGREGGHAPRESSPSHLPSPPGWTWPSPASRCSRS